MYKLKFKEGVCPECGRTFKRVVDQDKVKVEIDRCTACNLRLYYEAASGSRNNLIGD